MSHLLVPPHQQQKYHQAQPLPEQKWLLHHLAWKVHGEHWTCENLASCVNAYSIPNYCCDLKCIATSGSFQCQNTNPGMLFPTRRAFFALQDTWWQTLDLDLWQILLCRTPCNCCCGMWWSGRLKRSVSNYMWQFSQCGRWPFVGQLSQNSTKKSAFHMDFPFHNTDCKQKALKNE